MRARYIGDAEGHGPASTTLFGVGFTKGRWVGLPEDFPQIGKLQGNSHFEVDDGEAAPPLPAANEPNSATGAGVGVGVGLTPAEHKAAIRAEIEALGGTLPHPNAGLEKHQEALATAQAAKEAEAWESGED